LPSLISVSLDDSTPRHGNAHEGCRGEQLRFTCHSVYHTLEILTQVPRITVRGENVTNLLQKSHQIDTYSGDGFTKSPTN
jgi:hypothetical protein